jgi:hypothetical protein
VHHLELLPETNHSPPVLGNQDGFGKLGNSSIFKIVGSFLLQEDLGKTLLPLTFSEL